MPLGKKKTKSINTELDILQNVLRLWLARASISKHDRTTIQGNVIKTFIIKLNKIRELTN